MAYSVDYSDDWQYVDGIEALTYTPPTGTALNVHGCRATTAKTAGAGGQSYSPEFEGATFYLWSDDFGAVVPQVEGTLTDEASVIWVIYDVTRQSDQSQWGVLCRKAT